MSLGFSAICAAMTSSALHAGKYNLLCTLLAVVYFGFYRGSIDVAWIYDNFLPLLSAAVSFSFLLSLSLYYASYRYALGQNRPAYTSCILGYLHHHHFMG